MNPSINFTQEADAIAANISRPDVVKVCGIPKVPDEGPSSELFSGNHLSKNFTLEELTASATAKIRNIRNIPSPLHLLNLVRLCREVLQPIRDKYGKSIKVTSGYRSETLNKALGGVKTSQHLKGEAADITSADNHELWDIICKMILEGEISVGQLIDEKNLKWIHISVPDSGHRNQILHL